MTSLPALTIKQPWASLIVYGDKRIENRNRRPPDRYLGGLLAIHAGKTIDETYENGWPGGPDPLPLGCILGVARLTGVVTASADPWFEGPFGWVLANVRPVTPVPCRGMQGLWMVGSALAARILAEYEQGAEHATGNR